tara:strand:+ start:1407 stop:3182 length:1776 start_codon:yes stop_codon:yes gene_type:complete
MPKNPQDEKFYLGNRNLPKPEQEFEWTPQMARNLKKVRKNILHFAENYFHIVNLDRGKEKIKLHNCQKKVLRQLRDNRFVTLLASRQVGKTTMMTIYCLWIACFQDDQRILIVANKEQTAINIFKRVRTAYEMLPNYLKPGVEEYGKTGMTLANGSSIGISTTSSDAGRGDSCNVLILDELAFIDNHLVKDFWKSVFPIISSSKKSKIFIASTPNGTDNLFYDLYSNAEKGINNWSAVRIDWWEVPGRDEKWKEDTIKALGSVEAFNQEFGNVFLQTGESAIDDELFDKLKLGCREPQFVFDDGKYLLWEEPKPENIYVIGVDISEGVGENASVAHVMDMTDLKNIKQVATYWDNHISPYKFTTKLHEILSHWGFPPAAIERNNCGAQVVDNLVHTHGFTNLISFSPKKSASASYDRLGVIAHTNTKYKGVMNMRYWVNELRCVEFRDINTINELKDFVRYPNGTWAAKKEQSCLDDRVMSLIWSLIALETSVTQKHFDIVEYDDNERPAKIQSIDYGVKHFINPTSIYANEKGGDTRGIASPVYFPGDGSSGAPNDDIDELNSMGWHMLGSPESTDDGWQPLQNDFDIYQ